MSFLCPNATLTQPCILAIWFIVPRSRPVHVPAPEVRDHVHMTSAQRGVGVEELANFADNQY